MARPRKQTVDYFPHYCDHKTTMFVIEQKYGNDGYAFWFKLLEILGGINGHYLDLRDPIKWEFLQAKTHLGPDTCHEMLALLSRLDAIDAELWNLTNVVWSQNFVDGLWSVYANRKVDIPSRPTFLLEEIPRTGINTGILQVEIPQGSKGSKGSKGSIENPPVDNSPLPLPDEDETLPPEKEAVLKTPENQEQKTTPPAISGNTHGERWTKKQAAEFEEIMKDIGQRLKPFPFQKVLVFTQTHFNRCNPEAMNHCLRSFINEMNKGKDIALPDRWLLKAMETENAKYEARESEQEHEERMVDEARDVGKLIAGIGVRV